MAFTSNLQDRERDKFVESTTRPSNTAVEVVIGNASEIQSINGALSNIKWDAFDYQYPTTTQEIIRLYEGGLVGTLKATVTLNYTDSTKKYFTSGTVV
jgi:hypothetical protein